MDLLTTTATAIGRLALAEAIDGPQQARMARPANGASASGKEPERVLWVGWRWPEALVNSLVAAGWLIERRTLRSRHLDKDARAAVTFKDILMAGAVATGLASGIGAEVMKRVYPDGVRVTAQGELSPAGADRYLRSFRLMGLLNRAFVTGAVAATPFINFALFNDYKPHPLRSFFKL